MTDAENALKVVLLGMKNVGKTCIFNRYVNNEYPETRMTIGAYYANKECRIGKMNYSLAIWDTAGEERFDALTSFYCRGSRCAIICYDLTNWNSFANLERWVKKVKDVAPDCAIVFAGNKLDIIEEDPTKRAVELEEAQRFASSMDANIVEVSAKTGQNIPQIFEEAISKYLASSHSNPEKGRRISDANGDDDSSCC
uniref:Ras-related protein Rab-24-like n=1 Tax=Hirondellea gigas TaxID=1518452 RepID=A0A6A7GAK5_9CRUS